MQQQVADAHLEAHRQGLLRKAPACLPRSLAARSRLLLAELGYLLVALGARLEARAEADA
jgi:hypothetical protein